MIPLAWVEAAQARWPDAEPGEPVEIGCDVARYGSDETVIAIRRGGGRVEPLLVYSQKDTMETAGLVKAAYTGSGLPPSRSTRSGLAPAWWTGSRSWSARPRA